MKLSNVKRTLSNGESVFLSIFITTPEEDFSFPFTREGFEAARPLWNKVKSRVLSFASEDEDFQIKLVSDDGFSDIYVIGPDLLTRVQYCKWREFLKYEQTPFTLTINEGEYQFRTYASLVRYLANELEFRGLLDEWKEGDSDILDYSRDVLDCTIVKA